MDLDCPSHFRDAVQAGRVRRANTYFDRTYDKALDSPNVTGFNNQVVKKARALREILQRHDWKGSAGRSRLKVLLAHIAVYEQCCLDRWTMPERRGSDISRLSHITFNKYNNILSDEGWLKKIPGSRGKRQGSQFEFGYKLLELLEDDKIPHYVCYNWKAIVQNERNNVQFQDYGVFERVGMGYAAERIWSVLGTVETIKAAELATASGCHRNTVRTTLQKMDSAGMVTITGKVIMANRNFDFLELAGRLDTTNIADNRHKSHQADIYADQERLEYWRQRHPKAPFIAEMLVQQTIASIPDMPDFRDIEVLMDYHPAWAIPGRMGGIEREEACLQP